MVEIDSHRLQSIQAEIRKSRATADQLNENARQNREEIEKGNAALLQISEKISQSKNFLLLIHSRLASETEEGLVQEIQSSQSALAEKRFKSGREKDELLSKSKEATMKLEAIRATKSVNDQLTVLNKEASALTESISQLAGHRESLQSRLTQINVELDMLYTSKRRISSDRDSVLASYAQTLKRFESVNSRLDAMSEMRKRQRQEYGYALPNDMLFKVKEVAKKKLQSGSKLTFEELKLLYEDKTD